MDHTPPAAACTGKKIHRTSNPKVRTGCISCKKRRVKCDERRPGCLRCKIFGCSCDGYEFPIRNTVQLVPKHKLLPKPPPADPLRNRTTIGFVYRLTDDLESGNRGYLTTRPFEDGSYREYPDYNYGYQYPLFYNTAASDQLMIYSPSASIVESDQEGQYFRYYKEVTSPRLSGVFDTQTWALAFLQASHQEPFVRRAIIAIGALSKAWDVSQPREPKPPGECVKTLPDINNKTAKNPHYKFALQQYGKSIQRMREVISQENANIRTALLSCLLTVCFESLQGRDESALVQVQLGLQLMQEWVKKQPKLKHGTGLSSPAPYVIEDSLFHAFERLDIAPMLFPDKRPASFHQAKSLEGADTIENMPKFFTDIREAGNYFSVVSIRVVHFVKYVAANLKGSCAKQTTPSDIDVETVFPNLRVPLTGAMFGEIEAYAQEILRWLAAFQPVMEQALSPGYGNALLPAMFLHLYAKLEIVLCRGLHCMQECDFEEFLPEYTSIVTLVETIVSDPNFSHLVGRPIFSFDVNIILPLMVVGLKCRDWQLRRRAIGLLQNHPRRECTWDSSMAAGITLWMMALEEEDLEYGAYIPEQKRARLELARPDFAKRTAYLSATQTVSDGTTVLRETVIDW